VVITNVGDAQTRPLVASLNPALPELRLKTNCQGRQLRPGETCVVTAEFEPTIVGPKLAMGSVDDGAGGAAPVNFSVRGAGRLGPDAAPDLAPPPPADAAPGADAGARRPDASPEASPRIDTAAAPDAPAPRDTGGDRASSEG
jgi:hypothetical protein